MPGVDIAAAIENGIRNNGALDDKTRATRENTRHDGSSTNSGENQKVLPSRGISGVVKHEYRTSKGEVYGFYATDEKKIYIDETVAQPETPLHEYTHMWDDIVREKNPALWKRGVELMEKLGVWNKVEISRKPDGRGKGRKAFKRSLKGV
ncbi:MAG: hypothetical protein II951_01570 [Bacteroidales bacterium]|nr:hypothetical protein [Bacteroidales bacterium]